MSNSIPTDQLANGVTLSIKGAEDTAPIVISNVENINLPKQPFNAVEANLVNAVDGIKPRLLGSRAGGELTFKVNVLDASDAGLIRAIAAYNAKEEVTFIATYPSGITRTMAKCKISQCDPSDATLDSLIAYDFSAVCNAVMTTSTSA